MKTKVVNLLKEEYDVYIGRPSIFGNPYHLKDELEREKIVEAYKIYFYDRLQRDEEFKREVLKLKGRVLGCYCKPKKCHGDVIVEYLESELNV